MLQGMGHGVDLAGQAPVDALYLGTRLEVDEPMTEQVKAFLPDLLRIVPVLKHRARRHMIPYLTEVLDKLVVVFRSLPRLVHLGK